MFKGKESKPHLGIFGSRNNGKSSRINVLTKETVITQLTDNFLPDTTF